MLKPVMTATSQQPVLQVLQDLVYITEYHILDLRTTKYHMQQNTELALKIVQP